MKRFYLYRFSIASGIAFAIALLIFLNGYCSGGKFSEEVLLWRASAQGIDYTNRPQNVLITTDFTNNHSVGPEYDWNWGFRIGGGFVDSKWSYEAYWMRLETKAQGKKFSNSGAPDFMGRYPFWSMSDDTTAGDYVSLASSNWRMTTNLIDLLGEYRVCYASQLTVTPFAGLRVAFLNQKLTAKYEGGAFFSGVDLNRMRNNYYGLGPRGGTGAEWCFYHGFSLFGRAALTPLYGRFFIKQSESYLGNSRLSRSDASWHFLLASDYAAGVRWRGSAIQSRLYAILGVSWEGVEFFRANRLYRGSFHLFKKNRNINVQGITFSGALEF